MQRFIDLKVGSKLMIGFGVILIFIVAVSTTAFLSIKTLISSFEHIDHTHEVIETSELLQTTIVDMETGLRGFIITADENFLDPYYSGKADFIQLMQHGLELTEKSSFQQNRWNELNEMHQQWVADWAEPEIDKRKKVVVRDYQQTKLDKRLAEIEQSQVIDVLSDRIKQLRQKVSNKAIVEQSLFNELLITLFSLKTSGQVLLVVRDENAHQHFEQNKRQYSDILHQLIGRVPHLSRQLTQFDSDVKEWLNAEVDQPLKDLETFAQDFPVDLMDIIADLSSGEGKYIVDAMRIVIEDIINVEKLQIIERSQTQQEVADFATQFTLIGTLVSFIFGLLVAWFVSRSIVNPMNELKCVVNEISETGDLSKKVEYASKDEVGQSISALNGLLNQLKTAKEDASFYQLMIESTQDPVFLVNSATGETLYVNEAAIQLLKLSRKELLSLKLNDWLPNLYLDQIESHIDSSLPKTRKRLETELVSKQGIAVPVELSVNQTEYKGQMCYFGFFQDISERKQHETDLIEAKELAEYANNSKSDFLARMSHELRTPMNAILGFGQLLKMADDGFNQMQKDSVDHILRGGDHLLDLINEVLDIAKVDTGKMVLSIENIHVKDAVESALLLVTPLVSAKMIKLDVEQPTFDYLVRADLQRLKQVLMNLLSNAVKYNHLQGLVSLSYDVVHGSEERVEDYLKISITDSGFGIKEQDLKKVFEPFQRMDNENTEIEGTGIGLTITKKIIELMGGHVGFSSEYGKGSTFWVEMPLVIMEVTEEQVHEHVYEVIGDSEVDKVTEERTILYVEDNATNLDLVRNIINIMDGYTLLAATSAEEGIQTALEHQPDLILMDIDLPGMNGFQALEILMSDPKTQAIPVIALSAHAMKEHVHKGKMSKFKSYLTKPIDIKELIKTLDEYTTDKDN